MTHRAGIAAVVALTLVLPGAARADALDGGGFGVPPALSWEGAESRLLVQLRAVDDPFAEGAIFRQDVPFTRTVLVLVNAAGEARDVTVSEAAGWRQRPEDLFRTGQDNLLRRFPPSVRTTPELTRGLRVHLFYGEHPYAAAYALSAEDYPRCRGKWGTLLAVPNRHAMLCYPVESSRAFHAYLALVNLAADIQLSGEAPIVPHVYWLHEDRFETQRVILDGRRFKTERTPAFEQLLKDLPRDIHDPDGRPR